MNVIYFVVFIGPFVAFDCWAFWQLAKILGGARPDVSEGSKPSVRFGSHGTPR